MPVKDNETNGGLSNSLITALSSQGVEVRATPLRLTRYLAVFEIYNPAMVLRSSEILSDFKIVLNDRTIYSGRAVVSGLVNSGAALICEVRLDESSFHVASFSPADANLRARDGFGDFLTYWQKTYRIRPEFKVVVADMQTFLSDLRMWLEQVELEIRSLPTGDRMEIELQTVSEIGEAMVPAFNAMHERLEALGRDIEEEFRPVHQNFAKRQLHPLMLCSPFAYRTYHKPLGYAGDYEMVNMMMRDPYEGASLYAKVVNLWFLRQWPAEAHRNRIIYLKRILADACLRGERLGRPARILNLGCGPAREIQDFIGENPVSDHASFMLWDFNNETIEHTGRLLEDARRTHNRRTQIQLQKKSVHQVLKEGAKPVVTSMGQSSAAKYDMIYCAGLFDYLSDKTCKQLMNIFYGWLVPDGLLAATNVDDCKPFRHMLEFILDWHLIYRGAQKGRALLPDRAAPEWTRIEKDVTEVNVFIEARKPNA